MSEWNWLDWILVIYIAFSALQGWRLGFMRSALGLAGLVLAVLGAKLYAPVLARWLEANTGLPAILADSLEGVTEWGVLAPLAALEPEALAAALLMVFSFAAIALAIAAVAALLAASTATGLRYVGLGLMDDVLGLGFGAIKSAVLVAIILGLWASFMPMAGPGWENGALDGSQLASPLLDLFYYLSPLSPGA